MIADTTVVAKVKARLPPPASAIPVRVEWVYAVGIVGCHLIASLAFLPWFFSLAGVIVAVLGVYVFGTLGINIGFHRLLTHKSFVVPKWLERTLAILGVCAMQDTPAMWVGTHRRHHQFPDDQPDPHSPLVSFFWAHGGWVMFKSGDLERNELFNRYARDIMRDRLYAWLERHYASCWVVFGSWCLFLLGGLVAELLSGATAAQAAQFGLSLLVWGVFVRTVVTWHLTWSINSVTHLWGYRNYPTNDGSRNNGFIGIITSGEGWHNNHHADPRSARHGHKWWEFDLGWITIRVLMWLGLATNVVLPSRRAHKNMPTGLES